MTEMMTMRQERAPDGTLRHVPAPFSPPAPRKRKARPVPDPIKANPEAAAQQLAGLIQRVETLDAERLAIVDDINDVYAEAKALGYDTKGVRAIIALRKLDPDRRAESESILETYKTALGL